MKRFGRVQGLVLALGLPAFYRDVARHWGGIGILYVLLLLTLTWIPMLVKIQLGFNHFVENDFPNAVKDLPAITLQGGKVSAQVQQPYTVVDQKTGNPVFVLDTTGAINSLEQTPAIALLTEKKLHIRNQGKIEIHDLSQFPDMSISKELIQDWLTVIGAWLGVALFPLVMIGSLIRALVLMLLAALLGLIFNAALSARLNYAALLRLAAVGMTLSVYIDTGLGLAGITVPFWFLIALALTTGYVAFGAKVAGAPDDPAFAPPEDFYDEPRKLREPDLRERDPQERDPRDLPPSWPSDAVRGDR